MNNPQYCKVDNVMYKINTDFRVALECNDIARNETIGDNERGMAIIYKLFGEQGLDCPRMDKLIELSLKYISLSNEEEKEEKNKNDFELDFLKCKGLIKSSFKYDYGFDPYELPYYHWYDFYNDLQNLSTSEFGNCCILNRVISILNQDVSKIKDEKTKRELVEAKKILKSKYCIKKEVKLTKEQEQSAEAFYKALGIL